jgi:hypothetical protein
LGEKGSTPRDIECPRCGNYKKLREQGFDDRDILDIIYVICLYNFNDRMAETTGTTGHDFLSA